MPTLVKQVKCPASQPSKQNLCSLAPSTLPALPSPIVPRDCHHLKGQLLLCSAKSLCLCWLCSLLLHSCSLPVLPVHIWLPRAVWMEVIGGVFLRSRASSPGVRGVHPGTTRAKSASVQLHISHQLTAGLGTMGMLTNSLFKERIRFHPCPPHPCF